MAKVSVVIPSYNHAQFIGAALRSLSDQTFREFEVVIVDDGSTDNSVSVIEEFIKCSPITVTLMTQPNAGADAALNRGIEASRGDIIAILNSDDVYHSRRLEQMIEAAPRHIPFIAFSEFEFVGKNGEAIPNDPHNVWYREALEDSELMPSIGFMLVKSNISVSTSNFVFSRSLYESVGPFRHFRIAHDLDFILRCAMRVNPIFIRSKLLSYRLHGRNTISLNRDVEYEEVRTILDEYVRAVIANPPDNAVAPGARQMPLFSEYFLCSLDHWSGPLAPELRQALSSSLDIAPTGRDAVAFRLEVDRLAAELRRLSSVPAALEAAHERAGNMERELHDAKAAQANAREQLGALQASTSWRITAPVRHVARGCRSLLRRF